MFTVSLRKTTPQDLAWVRQAEAHNENCNFVYQWSAEQHLAALTSSSIAHFIIQDSHSEERVGYVILDEVDNSSHSINLRRLVVTRKNCGIGRQALELIKDLAFTQLNAHRLWLDVFTDNLTAYNLYKKVGFIEEGKLRESYLRNGEYASQYIMAILVV